MPKNKMGRNPFKTKVKVEFASRPRGRVAMEDREHPLDWLFVELPAEFYLWKLKLFLLIRSYRA